MQTRSGHVVHPPGSGERPRAPPGGPAGQHRAAHGSPVNPNSMVSGASYDSMRAHHGSTSVIEPAQHMNHHYHQQHGLAGGAGGSAVYPNVGFPGTGAMPTSALPPQPMTLPVSSAQHAIHYNNSNYATTPAAAMPSPLLSCHHHADGVARWVHVQPELSRMRSAGVRRCCWGCCSRLLALIPRIV